MISAETLSPYDRPLLSKLVATVDAAKIVLRNEGFFKEAEINLRLNLTANSVDPKSKTVKLSDGSTLVTFPIN